MVVREVAEVASHEKRNQKAANRGLKARRGGAATDADQTDRPGHARARARRSEKSERHGCRHNPGHSGSAGGGASSNRQLGKHMRT